MRGPTPRCDYLIKAPPATSATSAAITGIDLGKLKADGSALTGWLTLDNQSGPVKDGKIEKSTVAFAAVIAGRTLTFTGEVVSDEMALRLEGAQYPVALKRAK